MTRLEQLVARAPWTAEQAILCGSAAITVRGGRDVQDLDLLLDAGAWADLADVQEKRAAYGREIYRIKGIDAFDTLPRLGLTFDQVIERDAFTVHPIAGASWRVLDLRHVLAIKALAPPAEKHTLDMAWIVGSL